MPSLASLIWLTIVTVVGLGVWAFQRQINNKQAARLVKEKERLEEVASRERDRAEREKERAQVIAQGHQVLQNRVSELEKQNSADTQTLALLKQEMLPMAEAMKRKLVDLLTHPSEEFKVPDALLAKVKQTGASMPPKLTELLKERVLSDNPHVTEQEKLAAEALPIITRLAELEAREPHLEVTGLQLVSSTVKTPQTKKSEEA